MPRGGGRGDRSFLSILVAIFFQRVPPFGIILQPTSKIVLEAPLASIYTNFEGKRAPKNAIFSIKNFQKVPKNGVFGLFFFGKTCQRRRECLAK